MFPASTRPLSARPGSADIAAPGSRPDHRGPRDGLGSLRLPRRSATVSRSDS